MPSAAASLGGGQAGGHGGKASGLWMISSESSSWPSAQKGSSPRAITKSVTPSAQTSAGFPATSASSEQSSGELKAGEPCPETTRSLLACMIDETPKSVILTQPSEVARRLSGLMSRWMIELKWR